MRTDVKGPTKKRVSLNGGKTIGSGGFGCVFRPALKCKGKSRTKKRMVSKLMESKYAKIEYDEIMKFKTILKTIPNYKKYFLLDDITICDPDKLTPSDLYKFNSKCHALEDSFYENTINSNLDKLKVLTIPDGGVDLRTYIKKSSYTDFPKINNKLIDLLVNGVIKMNKKNVLHADLKDSNILMDDKCATIIDWGLSATCESTNIPERLQNRSIYYNLPFTTVLFNHLFEDMYIQFLKENEEPSYQTTRAFVEKYIEEWLDYRGDGHYNLIKRLIKCLFVGTNLFSVSDNIGIDFIANYLTVIIMKFTKDGKMGLKKYFNDVYRHIIDIWGFLTIYLNLLETLADNYSNLTNCEIELYDHLKKIVLTHMYEPRTEPNNINKIVEDLKALNPLFYKCGNNYSIGFSKYSKTPSTSSSEDLPIKLSKSKTRKIVKQIIHSNKIK
jgi:serine/threonine protein kinase